MRTFFAHQSVGADIVTGIAELADRGDRAAQVVDLAQASNPTRNPAPEQTPDNAAAALTGSNHGLVIIHDRIGANREPLTKIAGFRAVLDTKQRPEIDVALLKFCYVDVATQAQAEQLWPRYVGMIEDLSTAHPRIRLVHCTVPLRQLPQGPYAWLRRMLGHRHPALEGNRARDWFNRQLRQRFSATDVFDLAALQARRADGQACECNDRGTRVPSLAPEWTYDGGHLNARGRTMVAAAFLEFLQTLQDPE